MANKRKQTPQASTLLDFFGKGATGSAPRQSKKPRTKPTASVKQSGRKRLPGPEDIIVIDSDEDDVDISAPQPCAKPLRSTSSNSAKQLLPKNADPALNDKAPVLRDISALPSPSGSTQGTDTLAEDANVKSEPDGSQESIAELRPSSPDKSSESVSFGFPDLLVARDTQSKAAPSESPTLCRGDSSSECKTEDVAVFNASAPSAQDTREVEDALLEGDDWDMGDDEIEFVDVETRVKAEASEEVDKDLTLEEEADGTSGDGGGAIESCPICDRQLIGMSTLVCPYLTSIPLDMPKTQMVGNS